MRIGNENAEKTYAALVGKEIEPDPIDYMSEYPTDADGSYIDLPEAFQPVILCFEAANEVRYWHEAHDRYTEPWQMLFMTVRNDIKVAKVAAVNYLPWMDD